MVNHGIVLAGGTGSRLKPLTNIYSKQLLYLSGKAVIDYPVQTLIDLGVKSITVILGSGFAGQVIDYCGDGSKYGININYVYQANPDGISQAISLCEKYVDDNFFVILGDNVFENQVKISKNNTAKIFLTENTDLHRFGVATICDSKIINIEEKPKVLDVNNKNYAITGLYQFNKKYFEYFRKTTKSARNEYEITDIINAYRNDGLLDYEIIGGDWSDAGTIDGLNYLNYKLYNPATR